MSKTQTRPKLDLLRRYCSNRNCLTTQHAPGSANMLHLFLLQYSQQYIFSKEHETHTQQNKICLATCDLTTTKNQKLLLSFAACSKHLKATSSCVLRQAACLPQLFGILCGRGQLRQNGALRPMEVHRRLGELSKGCAWGGTERGGAAPKTTKPKGGADEATCERSFQAFCWSIWKRLMLMWYEAGNCNWLDKPQTQSPAI